LKILKFKENPLALMLRFMWANAPSPLKYFMLVLALIAGFTRDMVMMILNKAAAAPLDQAISIWLPVFVVTLISVIGSAFAYQLISTMVITAFTNKIRLRMINNLFNVQPGFLEKHEHGSLYHILTTDVSIISGFSKTALGLVPSIVFLLLALPFHIRFWRGFLRRPSWSAVLILTTFSKRPCRD
jgi:putative pyoverdin transport system ATP-binding/permease protein